LNPGCTPGSPHAAQPRSSRSAAERSELPAELEHRLAALEQHGTRDFERRDVAWMLILGVALPVLLIVVGWFA
jgi:hypothetical protein